MLGLLTGYTRWLHTMWPAGRIERLPRVNDDLSTNVPGLFIVGDLTGIPLLKFAADSGTRAVQTIATDPAFAGRSRGEGVLDLVIIGGGVSGFAAALEAKKRGLSFEILESSTPFSTIVNFPRGKPIYTYPTEMTPAGDLQFSERSDVREGLIKELSEKMRGAGIEPRIAHAEGVERRGGVFEVMISEAEPLRAHRVIIAIGRSGNFRRLGIPGEELDKVTNRLHDPRDHCDRDVAVIGGGDTALETAIAIAECGGRVTLSYRKKEFSRPKAESVERLEALRAEGRLTLMMGSRPREITEDAIVITDSGGNDQRLPNDAVFVMIGREPPLDFLRRSGVRIHGEWTWRSHLSLALVLTAAVFVYHWKKGGVFLPINEIFARNSWFPFAVPTWWQGLGKDFANPAHLLGTLRVSLGEPGFYYSLAYCLCVILFGIRRIRRRRTPYVTVQTLTLTTIQVIPLFLLPYILLPWAGNNGWFDSGWMKSVADELFPQVNYGHGREYWRAFGLILAWPLFFWNVFTSQPMWGWLIISLVQTFVIIPLLIRKWGKGAYCGWICSCGALAETMGDAHRHKMPHGPAWNRLNMIGQVFLLLAFLLLITRSLSWIWPESVLGKAYELVLHGIPALNYVWFVDLFWAGILGVGLYWHFSGRVWCRFACPLAALMHIFARFSRFRILADKKRCISCNVCTSVCHQGIDVMGFANRGRPMEDPECVRCSACVQSCPTGVLQFGEVNPRTGETLRLGHLAASPVLMRERGEKTPSST
ncbi:NAD(P)-binding domain-containing protein [Candidatus Sumerlaeota bacterium]|nr:NAD(P)-binding domain-containing protein [Candidatus Sumerlaeota bacterium]